MFQRTHRVLALTLGYAYPVFHPDAGESDRAVDLLDLAFDFGAELVRMTGDPARFQRAA